MNGDAGTPKYSHCYTVPPRFLGAANARIWMDYSTHTARIQMSAVIERATLWWCVFGRV